MAAPLVSIGMPVRNCARFVRLAVASIQAQTLRDWELFVIDDGSIDGTLEALGGLERDPRIRLLADGRQQGLPRRLNEAIGHSRGRFFARMDGDDISYPQRLEHQVALLEADRAIDLVGAQLLIIDEAGTVRGERRGPLFHEELCHRLSTGFRLFHPTYCGRLEWFQRWGYRDSASEDQDLLLRAHRSSRFANAPDLLLAYRVGPRLRLARHCQQRWDHLRAVQRSPDSRFRDSIRSALAHAARALVDASAVVLHLDDRPPMQRAWPTTELELARWEHVYRDVTALAAGSAGWPN